MLDDTSRTLAGVSLVLSLIGIAGWIVNPDGPFRRAANAAGKDPATLEKRLGEADNAKEVGEAAKDAPRGEDAPADNLGCGHEGAAVGEGVASQTDLNAQFLAGGEKFRKGEVVDVSGKKASGVEKQPGAPDADDAMTDVGDFDSANGRVGIARGNEPDGKPGLSVEIVADEEEDAEAKAEKGAAGAEVNGKQSFDGKGHAAHDTRTGETEETP